MSVHVFMSYLLFGEITANILGQRNRTVEWNDSRLSMRSKDHFEGMSAGFSNRVYFSYENIYEVFTGKWSYYFMYKKILFTTSELCFCPY